MGSRGTRRQGAAAQGIVAFDFDGTLTWRDSFMAFLAWRSGPARYAAGLAALAGAGAAYLAHRDRGRIKAAAVGVFLRGLDRDSLAASCAEFAQSGLGRRLIRPDAAQCWREWKDGGAQMVIVTASPEEVVRPFAEELGADRLIGTRLAYDAAGRVQGAFTGLNCRGPEKVERLRAVYGPDVRLKAAYGDTSGDREMLQLAEVKGYRVFHKRP